MEEKISVIIPCYNVEKYIDRCLTSVVNQTIGLKMLEIICVNDGSTDGAWEKLCQWEKQCPENMLAVDCKENGAQGRARNIALSYASGECAYAEYRLSYGAFFRGNAVVEGMQKPAVFYSFFGTMKKGMQ